MWTKTKAFLINYEARGGINGEGKSSAIDRSREHTLVACVGEREINWAMASRNHDDDNDINNTID